jgi:type IV secretion system protein VirB9
MKIQAALVFLVSLLIVPAAAQTCDISSFQDLRLKSIVYKPGTPARLVAFRDTELILLFGDREQIKRIVVSDPDAVHATVSTGAGVITLSLNGLQTMANLVVTTNIREYQFDLEVGDAPAAAVLVRILSEPQKSLPTSGPQLNVTLWDYVLAGEVAVLPAKVSDDGSKTFIYWHADQVLPAVFGIGPTGGEEVVAGYMRSDVFVIDRVYPKLVFRIDDAKATAKRVGKRK